MYSSNKCIDTLWRILRCIAEKTITLVLDHFASGRHLVVHDAVVERVSFRELRNVHIRLEMIEKTIFTNWRELSNCLTHTLSAVPNASRHLL